MPRLHHPLSGNSTLPPGEPFGRDAAIWDTPCQRARRGEWPEDLLRSFTLGMAAHGLSVSTSMMRDDRRYALETLAFAHTLADAQLRDLAMGLFRHFERVQSGIPRFN
ncbi:MAG: hypothetical protein K2X51_13930 [Burkholderiales bacterium]|nr:hypothetical protein [Burkholderiales bacterium]